MALLHWLFAAWAASKICENEYRDTLLTEEETADWNDEELWGDEDYEDYDEEEELWDDEDYDDEDALWDDDEA